MENTGGFEPRCLKRKKESINFPFSHWYARRDWLRYRFAAASSLAIAYRRTSVRLSLVVAPFFQGSFPYCALKTEKLPIGSFLFLWYARRDWLRSAAPPLRSLPKATGILASAFRLRSNPSFQGSLPCCAYNKKTPIRESFLIMVRAQGLASPPRRSFSNAHRRPKVRLSLVVEPFFQGSLPYGAKNKKLPIGSLFCFGTRAGIGFAATALIL